MKKILIFLTPIILLGVMFYGCSKDNVAPTYSTYKLAKSPENVEATYDAGKDIVNVAWTMADTSGVGAYFVAVSDSSVFDEGETRGFNTVYGVNEYEYDAATYIPAATDSIILYFAVSAVYKNEVFNYFIGPRAVIDSALVLRK